MGSELKRIIISGIIAIVFISLLLNLTTDIGQQNNYTASDTLRNLSTKTNNSFNSISQDIANSQAQVNQETGISQLTMFITVGAYNSAKILINSFNTITSLGTSLLSSLGISTIIIAMFIAIIGFIGIYILIKLLSGKEI